MQVVVLLSVVCTAPSRQGLLAWQVTRSVGQAAVRLVQYSGHSFNYCLLGCTYTVTQPHAQHRAPVFIVSLVGHILLLEMPRVRLPLSLGCAVMAEQFFV